jgi:magnesium transporter
VIDCAFYSRGERQPGKAMTLEEAAACPRKGNNFVWIELHDPSRDVMAEVSHHFGLHELAVEDPVPAHQRPKVEPYDDFYFIVYKAARYDEPTNYFRDITDHARCGRLISERCASRRSPCRAPRC